jgi:hypothetical protein
MTRFRILVATSAVLASGLALAVGSHYVKVLPQAERDKVWAPSPDQPLVLAGYPDAAPLRDLDVCVTIGFLIDARGRTSKFVELKSWSSASGKDRPSEESIAPFTQIAAAALARREFAPVGSKRSPVYTDESFSFAGSGKLDDDAIADRCRVKDLRAVVSGELARRIQLPILSNRYESRMERGHQCEWFSLYCTLLGDMQ